MQSTERVRTHFENDAQRFDSIYVDANKSAFSRFVDTWVRGVVVERLKLIRTLVPVKGEWSVLDVGCGPGRFAVDLATRGATRVLGIDISQEMLDLAKALADKHGVTKRCEFAKTSFKEFDVNATEKFDVTLGIGYFDYLEDPLFDLKKMVQHTRGHVFGSFPKRYEWRVPIRKVRFMTTGGFVRFYSRAEVEELLRQSGVSSQDAYLIDLGRDYLAVARVG